MFFHIFFNRIKCIIRDKQMMFWTMLFPILLGTLFNLAFSNLDSEESFIKVNVAVIKSESFNGDENFKTVLSGVDEELFSITYTQTEEEADKLLKDGKVAGYILHTGNDIGIVISNNGLNQTILKSFLDSYKQTQSTVNTLIANNPQSIDKILKDVAADVKFLTEEPVNKTVTSTSMNYFYTLIAMACLYGGFLGLKEVSSVQANLSAQGARVSIAPTNKFKVFLVSMCAAVVVQLVEILVLMLYLVFALRVDFGNQLGYIALTCVVGTVTGASFGAMIASVVKGSEGIKVGVLISSTMAMSFLSGMMVMSMKYLITKNVPLLAKINPASLITDCFYALYYYTGHAEYYQNIVILCVLSAVFAIITFMVLRRQKYASL